MRHAIAALAVIAGIAPATARDTRGLSYAALGQQVSVGGPRVRPLAVLEDSRCPAGVVCVWAGRVRIAAEVTTGRGRQRRELTLGEPIRVADGTLLLADARPRQATDRPLAPRDYRLGFRFDGGL